MSSRKQTVTLAQLDELITNANRILCFPEGTLLMRGGNTGSTTLCVKDPADGDSLSGVYGGTKRECYEAIASASLRRDMLRDAWHQSILKMERDGKLGKENALVGKGDIGTWTFWIADEAYQAIFCAPDAQTVTLFFPIKTTYRFDVVKTMFPANT